ncbi:VPLPA-CTERM sorting domain-containing protein [Paracoccus sp. 1_MG-2023]|uniref:VPLPA-CTERM sorting domain-containing protein n=1 Tax=unclassified Paracoccus (in: a-proteobacteria) TaxID=2688777 RepID=UPI001C085F61|nr:MULTISPECIES: VPLPA-CTERM sorting domain-containing protein [unclassified Paracoccus (in: a-proteobacteria)]MBU2958943.1 VPLPA-CTERM sorting domain-containing protein [Paracoccus sp. C2R09]MDO6669967.1 VPLPA-CTERM sorting domain-containing protein [Paracoccus sp. 1_MG-2023]
MRLARFIVTLFTLSTGSIASAASVQNIDVQLNFDGRSYFDFELVETATGVVLDHSDELTNPPVELGLPQLFPFTLNEKIGFTATIEETGGLTSCNLGGIDCTLNAKTASVIGNEIDIAYGPDDDTDNGRLFGGLLTGDLLYFDFLQQPLPFLEFGPDYFARWTVQRAFFTVAEGMPQPAPVPLPASALLLGAACAAMGMMRRRQNGIAA